MNNNNELNIEHKNLKHPLIFLENINADNLLAAESWHEIYNCFAQVLSLNNASFTSIDGMEFGHINIENLCIFKIRYKSNLSNRMRLKFYNRYFEIKKITNLLEANKVLQIIALEVI